MPAVFEVARHPPARTHLVELTVRVDVAVKDDLRNFGMTEGRLNMHPERAELG